MISECVAAPAETEANDVAETRSDKPRAIVRRMPDAKGLVGRLGTKSTVFIRTDKPVEDVTLDEDEQRLLDAADGKRTLYDLINTPPLPAGMNARIVYAFVALELLAAKAQERVKVRIRTEGDTYSS